MNVSTASTTTKTNSRIRVERKYGEDITNGNLLEEFKKKDEMKRTKINKPQPVKQSQHSTKKKK
jgi:hypothetical protein